MNGSNMLRMQKTSTISKHMKKEKSWLTILIQKWKNVTFIIFALSCDFENRSRSSTLVCMCTAHWGLSSCTVSLVQRPQQLKNINILPSPHTWQIISHKYMPKSSKTLLHDLVHECNNIQSLNSIGSEVTEKIKLSFVPFQCQLLPSK